nr:F-box protein SKIP31-like [Ipomoea batatas]
MKGGDDLAAARFQTELSLSFLDKMERLPSELCLKILRLLDHHNLAAAQLVCRRWKALGSEESLWCDLFKERWGLYHAAFYAPTGSRSWKDTYAVQDRCDRVGLGLKIIREGDDYYLIHGGEIQRHLGKKRDESSSNTAKSVEEEEKPGLGMLDKILFFIGDLESATMQAKRNHLV